MPAYPAARPLTLVVVNPQVPLPEINFSPVEEMGSPILADLPLLHITHPLGTWPEKKPSLPCALGGTVMLIVLCCSRKGPRGDSRIGDATAFERGHTTSPPFRPALCHQQQLYLCIPNTVLCSRLPPRPNLCDVFQRVQSRRVTMTVTDADIGPPSSLSDCFRLSRSGDWAGDAVLEQMRSRLQGCGGGCFGRGVR